MTILLLTREYKHDKLPTCGGTGSFMANLARELVKKEHQVYVLGINKSSVNFVDNGVTVCFKKNIFRRNPVVNFFRSLSKKSPLLQWLHFKIHRYEKKDVSKIVTNFIKKNNLEIDILETHDFEGLYLYLNTSFPIVIRCHGSFSVLEHFFNYKGVEAGKKHCEELAFKKAKNIISISEFSEQMNRELFGINNFKRIYNGIDTTVYNIAENQVIIPKSIFYFGTVAYEKGADIALQILIKTIQSEPNTSLHFIGTENQNHKIALQKIIEEHQLEDKVTFYGFQKTQNLISLLAQAEVVIFPSTGETFGLALCEAMALNKVVIASNIPSFNEIITSGENGYIVDNVEEYCDVILKTFSDTNEANRIKSNARKSIMERFSQEKMIEETVNYYEKVITEFKN